MSQVDEPILNENKDRFVLFPIEHDDIWQYYKKAEASFWTAEEIDLSQDLKDWAELNDGERHFINTPKKPYKMNSSVMFSVFSCCCCSNI